MEKLYIATSSLNLNSILATESISPEIFYRNRDFGYKRFTKVEPNNFSNSIIAYNKIPDFKIEETDLDDYPLIIEISEDLINDEFISESIEIKGLKIIQLNKTIYLHPQKVKFLFFNNHDRDIALIKVEPSIETKLLPLYKNQIIIKDNESESFKWDKSLLSEILDLPENKVAEQIELDSKTNKLKGFYYSYFLGIILSSSIKEITLKEEFIDIAKLILDSCNPNKNTSISNPNIADKLDRFKPSIDIAQGNKKIPKGELINAKFLDEQNINKDGQSRLIDILKNLKPEKESFYQQLENNILESDNDIFVLIEDLKQYLIKPFTKEGLSLKTSRITRYISDLKKEESKKPNPRFLIENLNFQGSKITQLTDDLFDDDRAELYRNILNEMLDYPINNSQTFQEEKIELTLKIGKVIKEYKPNWEGSLEKKYLNSLMDNIEKYEPFELKSHPDVLFQSIALFIQKGEELEKLIDNLKKNQLPDFRIALGLWGSIFGFSALPKTVTNILFEEDNIDITKELYKDVQTKLHATESEGELNFEWPLIHIMKTKDIETPKKEIKNEFIDKKRTFSEAKNSKNEKKKFSSEQSKNEPKCPICYSDMTIRKHGKTGNEFYGCSTYEKTNCKGNQNIPYSPNAKKNNLKPNTLQNICEEILSHVEKNGHSKISVINKSLKGKIEKFTYNGEMVENLIQEHLSEKLTLKKIKGAKAVKKREKGLF